MKLIASDLDGTLLNERGAVSEKNAAAIKKALEHGYHFVAATGRSWDAASKPLQAVGINCPIISLNGAALYDERGNLLESIEMKREVAEKVLSVCREGDMYLEFFTNRGIFSQSREYFLEVLVDIMQSANPNLTAEEIREYAHLRFQYEPVEFIDDYSEIFAMDDLEIYKILGFSGDPDILSDVRQALEEETALTITSSGDINLEFNDPKAQKGIALQKLAERLDIPMQDVVAVGDNWNDVSMLKMAGLGVAMGNAADGIKEIADDVTTSNNEDGVARVIEEVFDMGDQ